MGTMTAESRTQSFIIKRPRLTKLLDESSARILLLFAPAGYGKTTLAREWIEGREGVVWYAGGPAMGDVAALAVGLAEALTGSDEVAERVRILAANGQQAERLAKAIATAAARTVPPTTLVAIDDYQHIAASDESELLMAELLRRTRLRPLLTSRVRPSWITTRMTLYGEALVLGAQDLAFTHDEALHVLGASPKQTHEPLLAQSQGWPAVIGLAARRSSKGPVEGLARDDLYDFFAEDLLRAASAELKQGLFLLALGADASDDIERAILGSERDHLVAAAASAGFLSRDANGSLAIHPLLRGFLLAKLRDLDHEAVDSAVKRVFTELVNAKRWNECLAALQAFPIEELVVSALSDALYDLLSAGRVSTLQQWLTLGRDGGATAPIFLLTESELALREGRHRHAQTFAERAGSLFTSGDLAARAHLAAARAAHMQEDEVATVENCNRAIAVAGDPGLRFETLWVAFMSAYEQEKPSASALLQELQELGSSRASDLVRIASGEAYLATESGGAREAQRICESVAPLLARCHEPLSATNFLNLQARLAMMLGLYERALETTNELIALAHSTGLEFAVEHASVTRIASLIGLRKLLAAERSIRELERSRTISQHAAGNVRIQQIRLRVTIGDLEGARTRSQPDLVPTLTPGLLSEFLAYRGLVLAASGRVDDAKNTLERAQATSRHFDAACVTDVALAITALAQDERNLDEAVATFRNIYARGNVDAVVLALRAYPPFAAAVAANRDAAQDLTAALIGSRDIDLGRRAGLEMPRELRRTEGLSSREREVHALLAQGRTNREIAQSLFISESTTKVHVRHIFEKLGVHTRAEAARAPLDT